MKTASKAEQMLAQCPKCNAAKVLFKGEKQPKWHGCIAVFPKLEKEVCPTYTQFGENSVDMGITKKDNERN